MRTTLGVLVALISAGALVGQGPARAIGGRVLDAAGAPVARARVLLRSRVSPELPGIVGWTVAPQAPSGVDEVWAVAGTDGRFKVTPPHTGPFQMIAEQGQRRSVPRFPVMAGAFVELSLLPALRVEGSVVDRRGEPVPDTGLRLVPERSTFGRAGCYRMPIQAGDTRTDDRGAFSLLFDRGYLEGPWWGLFVVPFCERAGEATSLHQLLRPIDSLANQRLGLRPGTAVAGLVVDAAARPVRGARIEEESLPGRAVYTDARGQFSWTTFARSRLWIRADGHAPRPWSAGSATRIVLPDGGRVRAQLVSPDAKAWAGLPVLLAVPRADGPPLEWHTSTDARGKLDAPHMPRGRVVLGFLLVDGVYHPWFAGEVGPTGGLDLGRVVVDPARSLTGVVVDQDRAPVAAARVAVWRTAALTDEPPTVTYTDRGGRFRFAAVPLGRVVVAVDAAERGLAHEVLAADAVPGSVALRLPEGRSLAGRVVDATGEPVAGAWVTIVRKGGMPAREVPAPSLASTAVCATTDDEGGFRFRGLPDDDRPWRLMSNWLRGGAVGGGATPHVVAGGDPVLVRSREVAR